MDTSTARGENPKEHVILIVDKNNLYGQVLASQIEGHGTTVLVSEVRPSIPSVIHIPFTKRVPLIPEGTYSHVILFSEEETEHELLKPLAEKANNDNAKLIYTLPYWLYTPEITDKLRELCKRWTLVLLGDVFDAKVSTSHIGQIFEQGKKHKKISLPDLGLETVRPIAYEDVVSIILHISFGLDKEHIYFAFSKHPYTALSIVHALQKNDPLLRIDFVSQEGSSSPVILPEGVYLADSDYPVLKKVQDSYESYSLAVQGQTYKPAVIISKKAKGAVSWRFPAASFISGILLFLLLPYLWTTITAFGGDVLSASAQQALAKENFNQAITYATASTTLYDYSRQGGLLLKQELGLVGKGEGVENLSQQIQTKQDLVGLILLTSQAARDLLQVTQGKTLTPQIALSQAVNEGKNALLLLGSLNSDYVPAAVQNTLVQLRPFATFSGQLLGVLPHLLGFDSPKTYALLLQDNTELRPGGGAIVAYGLVTVKSGRVGKLDIHNVYEADDLLKGHVEPPFAVRRYLQQTHWYLRDSNFAIDGVKNAQNAAFFLEQETGARVDGVLSVDMSFLQNIVDTLGNVALPEYNQQLTKDNFSRLVASHAQRSTYDPTSQTKDFLLVLLKRVNTKLLESKVGIIPITKLLLNGIQQKHVLFAFSDASIQQLLTVNNMSNAIWDARETNSGTVNDTTGLDEANVGINKVNSFLDRAVEQHVSISPTGSISGTLVAKYKNTHTNVWPGGEYKNYLRFVLPLGTTITNVSLNTIPQSRFPAVIDPKEYEAKTFKAPRGIEIEHAQESGKDVYGMLVVVPANASLDVSLSYTLSQKLNLASSTVVFDEALLKQPGTSAYPYTFTLTYPSNLSLTTKPKDAKIASQSAVVIRPLASDMDYRFIFVK